MIDTTFTDTFDAMLRARRSTRDFVGEPLDDAEVEDFLDLVLTAPTAFNMQARSVVVVSDPGVRAEVHAAARKQRQVLEAPLLLAFMAEPDGWEGTFDEIRDLNLASGYWDGAKAVERRERIGGFQAERREAGLSREFAIRDAMIAASFAILAAEARGWAASPMTGFNDAGVKAALGAADSDAVVALLLAVGPAASRPAAPARLPLERRVYRDRYPL